MLNYIWGFMIIIGILYASFTGNIGAVGDVYKRQAGMSSEMEVRILQAEYLRIPE